MVKPYRSSQREPQRRLELEWWSLWGDELEWWMGATVSLEWWSRWEEQCLLGEGTRTGGSVNSTTAATNVSRGAWRATGQRGGCCVCQPPDSATADGEVSVCRPPLRPPPAARRARLCGARRVRRRRGGEEDNRRPNGGAVRGHARGGRTSPKERDGPRGSSPPVAVTCAGLQLQRPSQQGRQL